jgi:hypothetical protein
MKKRIRQMGASWTMHGSLLVLHGRADCRGRVQACACAVLCYVRVRSMTTSFVMCGQVLMCGAYVTEGGVF